MYTPEVSPQRPPVEASDPRFSALSTGSHARTPWWDAVHGNLLPLPNDNFPH